jgi:hypothetical protein
MFTRNCSLETFIGFKNFKLPYSLNIMETCFGNKISFEIQGDFLAFKLFDSGSRGVAIIGRSGVVPWDPGAQVEP